MYRAAASDPSLAEQLQRALADKYHVEREIAGAGMSRIFLAEERALGRKVVIKVLPPILAAEVSTERFAREIRFAATLQQANIIPVHHAGDLAGLPYYVMPFVDGPSLSERLAKDGALPIGEALNILLDVAKALAYAHAHGVMHRDIKPSNILLSGGTAVVTDFGIAKAMLDSARSKEDAKTLTQLGVAVGTPAYMAPEQGAGDPAIDHRADIYSWGVLAYELLSGKHPFADQTEPRQMIAAHISTRPRSLRAAGLDVSTQVADLVMACLEKDADRRPSSAETIVHALEQHGSWRFRRKSARAYDSLLVLPLSNASSPDDEYLSDGLTEELIHALARLPGVRVIARASAFALKGKGRDPIEVAHELDVQCVLTGSVRRSGNRLRIIAELIDAADGARMWSERYDRELDDVFAVEDDISRAIVDRLRLRLVPEPSPVISAPTGSIAAYDLYLRGRFHWNLRTESGLLRSLEYFDSAATVDPGFRLAQAGLADAYLLLAVYGALAPREAIPRARAAAERVLAREADSPEVLTARASIRALYDHDWAGAEQDFIAATRSGPYYPTTHHWYAMHCLLPQGRFADAAECLQRARDLDPLSQAIAASAGILDYYKRDFIASESTHKRIINEDAAFGLSHYFLGLVRIETGQLDEAVADLERGAALMNDSAEVRSALGYAHGRAGDIAAARDVLHDLEVRAESRYISPVLLAQVYVGLGDHARALDALDRGYELRAAELPLLGVRPTFDALRGDTRFGTLVARIHGAS